MVAMRNEPSALQNLRM